MTEGEPSRNRMVAEAMRMCAPFMDDETLSAIESEPIPDQVYFWVNMYHRLRDELGREALRMLEQEISGIVKPDEEVEALPFRKAEESVMAHSFFAVRI